MPRTACDSLHVEGLKAPVTVNEDAFGVCHVFAQNEEDLFFAQGYLTARDRLQQMDLSRRRGKGRLAEIIGPSVLNVDIMNRGLGLDRVARATAHVTQASPEWSLYSAYARGVNARIREHREAGACPGSFATLGYEPEDWEEEDSVAVGLVVASSLALEFQLPILDTYTAYRALGIERMQALEKMLRMGPEIDPGPYGAGVPIDRETLEEIRLDLGLGPASGSTTCGGTASGTPTLDAPSPDTQVPGISTLEDGGVSSPGSNNWVVGGSLTASGAPLLANDPHLWFTLPNTWHEMHMCCPTLDCYGVAIPGQPGLTLGFNRRVAWGCTNGQHQQAYFYAEKTSPEYPGCYLNRGKWVPFRENHFSISVKSQESKDFSVRWSVHGPVLNDIPLPVKTGGDDVVSIASTAYLYSDGFPTVYGLMKACSKDDILAALERWGCPTQDFAYATQDGDFGIQVAGHYPVVPLQDPGFILPGTGEADWAGLIPFDRLPHGGEDAGGAKQYPRLNRQELV